MEGKTKNAEWKNGRNKKGITRLLENWKESFLNPKRSVENADQTAEDTDFEEQLMKQGGAMKVFLYKIYKKTLTFLGDIMVATKPPKTRAEQIIRMQQVIQTGDIVCRKYTYYLDSYLIAGSYSHSGIVINKDEIVHSIAEGVQFIHPIDFVKDTDGFIILRPRYKEDADKRKAIDKAIEHLNNKVEYDFLFNDPAKLYCHELSASCLMAGGIVVIPTMMWVGGFPFSFKMNTFLADNLIAVCDTVYKF